MQGKSSKKKLFKKFPGIYMNSYQGSKTSDSKGVLNIFNKARKILKNIENVDNIISMIYFDEMGLAEISKNNPLKVIHSQLEYDENKDKVAFVGVSNWILDACKMNRCIFLSIPEPDEEDLIETAKKIAKSFSQKFEVFKIFEKARNFIKNKDEKKTISLVYFDEMGLAEISKNNPLKVIHSQLEYDENETKVAFIGISNWTLDASKMNRGIHLSILNQI
jgi:DNA-directed RNA polymerase specialized sigma subunit